MRYTRRRCLHDLHIAFVQLMTCDAPCSPMRWLPATASAPSMNCFHLGAASVIRYLPRQPGGKALRAVERMVLLRASHEASGYFATSPGTSRGRRYGFPVFETFYRMGDDILRWPEIIHWIGKNFKSAEQCGSAVRIFFYGAGASRGILAPPVGESECLDGTSFVEKKWTKHNNNLVVRAPGGQTLTVVYI